MGEPEAPIAREELLDGLGARRASTTLYAIQRRTAYLAAEARQAVAPAICEDMIATQERAMLTAIGGTHDLDAAPTIQQIERAAPGWRHLVPAAPADRAALARRLATTYPLRAHDAPGIREALGWDDPAVAAAHRERYGEELATLEARSLPAAERRRWWRARMVARVAELSPFWTAFALTLTQTVGAGVLALPIAFAGVGPLPGLALLVVFGLINVVTVAAIAESFARTGEVRWGGAFFGRVVGRYLGRPIGTLLSLSLAALSAVALLAYYVGLAAMLSAATGVPGPVWATTVLLVTLAAVARGRLEGTIVTALAVGATNLVMILVLAVMALRHLDVDRLTSVTWPSVGGGGAGPEVLALVFGVVLISFFGHTAVASAASVVLRRDPSGRALVRGAGAAMLTAIAVYGLWTVAIGGAVPATTLAATTGTALEPLAEVAGSAVFVPGAVFAVLAMGMAAIVFSLGLHHQVTELFPAGDRRARLAGVVPLAVVYAIVLWLLLTDRESFAGALGLIGTLTTPLLVGIVPVLLLVAARRRGEYVPAARAPFLTRRVGSTVVYAVFLGALVAHAAVIWTDPLPRVAAATVAVLAVLATGRVVRAGALRPVAAIELRRAVDLDRHRLRLTVAGTRVATDVEVRLGSGDRVDLHVDGAADLPERASAVTIDLAAIGVGDRASSLRLWVHEVEPSGVSAPLDAVVTLVGSAPPTEVTLTRGVATVQPSATARQLHVRWAGPVPAPGTADATPPVTPPVTPAT